MSPKTRPAPPKPTAGIPPPDPGRLLPGPRGDVALGKVRRQIEVQSTALMAPSDALQGVAEVARATGHDERAQLANAVLGKVEAARMMLAGALAALDDLEAS